MKVKYKICQFANFFLVCRKNEFGDSPLVNFDCHLYKKREKIVPAFMNRNMPLFSEMKCYNAGLDINECRNDNNDCNYPDLCNNTEGGFTCSCPPNFIGDGRKTGTGCNESLISSGNVLMSENI
jgi:hypothetical protein